MQEMQEMSVLTKSMLTTYPRTSPWVRSDSSGLLDAPNHNA